MNAIRVNAIRKNHLDFGTPKSMVVMAGSSYVDGIYWRVPLHNAIQQVFDYRYMASELKPSADAVKVFQIADHESQDFVYAIVPDDATLATFEAAREATTADGAALPTVAIPDPIIEVTVLPNNAGSYIHSIFTDALSGNEKYFLSRVSVDGVALTENTAGGFDTLAALVTWADSNNAAAGDFANPAGTQLTLTNSTKKAIHFSVYKAKFWDSGAAPTLSGSNVFTVTVTVNGVVHTYKGTTLLASTVAGLNASPLAALGKFYVVSTTVRLASTLLTGTVSVAIGQVAP